MKLLTEQEIGEITNGLNLKHKHGISTQLYADTLCAAQYESDKAFHNRELERIFNELERVIGFSVNKNDTPDTWDEWQEFKKKELGK